MIRKMVLSVVAACLFTLDANAQPGLQTPISTAFTVSSSIESKDAACGPDDEVHLQYISQAGTIVVLRKKVGDVSWISKGLNQVANSTATTSRDIPALHVYPSGYGCIIWQSSTKTLISLKTPSSPDWSNSESLGTISSGLLQIDSGADCAVNDNGEVLAVWRDGSNIYESFRNAQGTWIPNKTIKAG